MNQLLMKWLKRIVVGFFAVVFVMGFFSKSLMTYTLPNVTVQKISSGTEVKSTSEQWGYIAAKRSEVVALSQNVIVETLYVKKGGYVKKGTPLFKVKLDASDSVSSPQLLKEKQTLLIQSMAQEKRQLESSYQEDLKQLTDAQQSAKESLADQKLLFETGALSKDDLQSAQKRYDDATAALAKCSSDYELDQAQLNLKLKEQQMALDQISNQLYAADNSLNHYAKIDADQVVTASAEGYLTEVPQTGKRYYSGETLGVLGICSSYKDLCFELKMSQRAYYMSAESSAPLSLTSSDGLKIGVVTFDYRNAAFQDGYIIVQGNFTQEPDIWVFPGQEVVSKSSFSTYIQDEVMAVPRSSVVTSGNGLEGDGSLIYMIRSEDDALGQSTVAVATPVEVVSMTDDYAIVKDLDYMPSDQVILNPSARITDGTKVYICQSSK